MDVRPGRTAAALTNITIGDVAIGLAVVYAIAVAVRVEWRRLRRTGRDDDDQSAA
jgi:hypothetical protein